MLATAERIKKCRAHADQCRAWAELSEHKTAREAFLAAAEQWDTLAREIEQIRQMTIFVQSAKGD